MSNQGPAGNNSFASEAIKALNAWHLKRNTKEYKEVADDVAKICSDLAAIQAKNLAPDLERAEVIALLDIVHKYTELNVLNMLGLDANGKQLPKQTVLISTPVIKSKETVKVENPLTLAIDRIDDSVFLQFSRDDHRSKWLDPLRAALVALDISKKTPAEKRQELQKLVTEVYVSAKQNRRGYNAEKIAANILTEVLKVPLEKIPLQAPQVENLVKKAIVELDIRRGQWMMLNDKHYQKLIIPLREKLDILDKANLTALQNEQQMQILFFEAYKNASQDPATKKVFKLLAEVISEELNFPLPQLTTIEQQPSKSRLLVDVYEYKKDTKESLGSSNNEPTSIDAKKDDKPDGSAGNKGSLKK